MFYPSAEARVLPFSIHGPWMGCSGLRMRGLPAVDSGSCALLVLYD